ncbi:hypothetical protein [Bradyrhizobium sp. CSS354]|uniref:hypothetical protein n=1 Tax=Bradyrhizobium sp. CSS354 TaxID=2699172 RepID=UPI0023AFF7AF|nr:hypothetical protein [Bradyrhizobium sp. CSS354]MDE5460196.1 hypothetical protein [Bradyrhizobium sp. CSS354]
MSDRREKIEALLNSPVAGERDAARAALERVTEEIPTYASPEWHAAIQEWCRKLQFCVSRISSPLLSDAEIVLVRNWSRNRGDPWSPGSGQIMAIYRKLKAADGAQDGAAEALTDQVGHLRVG